MLKEEYMKLVWNDINLQTHEIDLDGAVDVKINGLKITTYKDEDGFQVSAESQIRIEPVASNAVRLIDAEKKGND